MDHIINQLSGWIFILSGSVVSVLVFRAYVRFVSTRSFANFAWSITYFSLVASMVLLGLSRLLLNPSFEIMTFIFLFIFVSSSLWILYLKGTFWGIEQRTFLLFLSILPWVVFIFVRGDLTISSYDIRIFFAVLASIAISIYYITWFFSFIVSRHTLLDMKMSISSLPLMIACWLPLFISQPSGYIVISLLFLISGLLITYTWVKHGQKSD